MKIVKGVLLGPYEIAAHIGAGGMGEVWRARDQRIGRDVAVKVLPEFAPGDERVGRFEQEARAAGALNHPGLVTIYDVGTVDGSPYIVMELLEGQTLRDAIGETPPRPLPLRKTLDYAIQIASALAVAHEKGIIHRDLKPENIFITSDGLVKILDFGLAKLAPEGGERDRTGRHLTSTGMVVGTPGYMSPEQVRARPLDYRTDIFALGAVMYEMLCGRRAFERDSAVETMTAVLNEEPAPLTTLADMTPGLEAIVRHCMEKNPRERFQSARDLAFQLRMLPEFQHSRTDKFTAIPEAKKSAYAGVVTVLAVLALAAVGFSLLGNRPRKSAEPIGRTYQQLTFSGERIMFPTLAPDGKTFAYVSSQSGNRDIYVQRVDGRVPANITSDSPADDSEPAFSPDGSKIAFRSERDGGGIFVMGVTGESVVRLADVGHNPSWSPDGTRLVIASEGVELQPYKRHSSSDLWIIDAHTDAKRPRTLLRRADGVQPAWSPHGKRIAFWSRSGTGTQRDIWTIDPEAPQPETTLVRVTSDPALHWNPVWSPDGHYLYFGSDRDGTMNLWRVPMDENSGKPMGASEPLLLPAAFSGHFTFAQHGEMAFTTVIRSYRLLAFPFDGSSGKTGPPRTLFGGTQEILTFEPSPDQQSIAFTSGGVQEDVFIAKPDGSRIRQLTNDAAKDRGVIWSPDGRMLYFYSNRGGPYQIWSIRADGSGLVPVTDAAELKRLGAGTNIYTLGISPDGQTLAAQTNKSNVLVHLGQPLSQRLEAFREHLAQPNWSPDGTRIAGNLDDDGIGIYSLPSHRAERVSGHGGSPQWLSDNRVVFFEKQRISILDLHTGHTTMNDVPAEARSELADIRGASPRLSRDGSMLYARQTQEIGDIWMIRFDK